MMGFWWHWGTPWGWLGWTFMGIVFLVFLIWAIISIVRGRSPSMGPMCGMSGMSGHSHSQDYDHSLEILKERYARGEISREQFEQMKKDLEK